MVGDLVDIVESMWGGKDVVGMSMSVVHGGQAYKNGSSM